MFIEPIMIPVYFNTDDTTRLKELDINYPLTDCDIRKVAFYSVAALVPMYDNLDDNKPYTCVVTNGDEFYSPLSIEQITSQIKKHILLCQK